MMKQAESWLPYALAAVVAAVWFALGRSFPSDASILFLISGVSSAILVAFLGMVMVVLLSATASPPVAASRSGLPRALPRYLFEAIIAGMTLLTLAGLGFIINNPLDSCPTFKLIWVLAGSTIVFLLLRVFAVVFRQLRNASTVPSPAP